MKFNVSRLHKEVFEPAKVGNVYTCKGGSKKTSPKVWVIISIVDSYACMVGLNDSGEIVSAQKYLLYAISRWPVIGLCKNIRDLELNIELF